MRERARGKEDRERQGELEEGEWSVLGVRASMTGCPVFSCLSSCSLLAACCSAVLLSSAQPSVPWCCCTTCCMPPKLPFFFFCFCFCFVFVFFGVLVFVCCCLVMLCPLEFVCFEWRLLEWCCAEVPCLGACAALWCLSPALGCFLSVLLLFFSAAGRAASGYKSC